MFPGPSVLGALGLRYPGPSFLWGLGALSFCVPGFLSSWVPGALRPLLISPSLEKKLIIPIPATPCLFSIYIINKNIPRYSSFSCCHFPFLDVYYKWQVRPPLGRTEKGISPEGDRRDGITEGG